MSCNRPNTRTGTTGEVFLVGAGPGDPELLTLKAARLIEGADVIVHDRLVSREILALARDGVQMIDVGKSPDNHPVPQANINALLVSLAARHGRIVRLKGGDPYMFGRGSEEVATLRDAGVRYSVVPGISAGQGIAASTGAPLTHRGLATGVRFVTGHCRAGHALDLDWHGLAHEETTLLFYMGRGHAVEISTELQRAGMDPEMPVMIVSDGTRATEERRFGTLSTLGTEAQLMPLGKPVLMMIGRVVRLADAFVIPQEDTQLLERVGHG